MKFLNKNQIIIILLIISITIVVAYTYDEVKDLVLTEGTVCNSTNKYIVSIYDTKTYFGIGDYIRGLIYLKRTFPDRIVVPDYSLHITGKFYKNDLNSQTFVRKSTDVVHRIETELMFYSSLLRSTDRIIFVKCNAPFTGLMSSDEKEFIDKSFAKRKEFETRLNSFLNSNQLFRSDGGFTVLHVRTEDRNALWRMTYAKLDKFIEGIKIRDKFKIYVISNSYDTKIDLAKKHGLNVDDTKPIHTVDMKSDGYEEAIGTMFEFELLKRSKHIYQFNENPKQTSGFSKHISEVYNIPFTRIPS